jgi:hypothetical protein
LHANYIRIGDRHHFTAIEIYANLNFFAERCRTLQVAANPAQTKTPSAAKRRTDGVLGPN